MLIQSHTREKWSSTGFLQPEHDLPQRLQFDDTALQKKQIGAGAQREAHDRTGSDIGRVVQSEYDAR